jgi:hypothetical protein
MLGTAIAPAADADTLDTSDDPCAATAWERALLALPKGNAEVEKLRDASLRFLQNPWLPICQAAGWDSLELWGAFPAARIEAAKRRGDCLGLVPGLTLGMSCGIETIDEHRAVVTRKKTGARLSHRRELPGRQHAVLWWQAPFALDEIDTAGHLPDVPPAQETLT